MSHSMHRFRLGKLHACIWACVLLSGGTTWAQSVFTSPRGYSLTIPAGWEKAPSPKTSPSSRTSQPVDEQSLDLVIYGPADETFRATANVVIGPSGGRITSQTEKTFADQVKSELARVGVTPTDLQIQRRKVNGREALWAVWINGPYRVWSVVIPTPRRIITITCADLADRFDKSQPTFSQILDSLHVQDADFAVMPRWVLIAVAVCVIWTLLGALRRWKSRIGSRDA